MEKTYVFDTNAGGFNSEALIASLMNNRGVDPNLMAMLTNGSKNQDAWGGGLHRGSYREGFEEKIEKLKERYK